MRRRLQIMKHEDHRARPGRKIHRTERYRHDDQAGILTVSEAASSYTRELFRCATRGSLTLSTLYTMLRDRPEVQMLLFATLSTIHLSIKHSILSYPHSR